MFKIAKCPNCNQLITHIYFEGYDPSYSKGGSTSYVAVAEPCGHALSAVPAVWEVFIQNLQSSLTQQNREIQNLKYQIDEVQNSIQALVQRLR